MRIHRAPAPSRLPTGWGAAVALVLLWWVMAVSSVGQKSTTFDELAHLTAGYSYWLTGDFRLHPENGNLPQRWAALPLLLRPLPLPRSRSGGVARGRRARPTTRPVNDDGPTRVVSSTPAATSSRWNIGQAHGAFPPPDNGRLIGWFADTDYPTYCLLFAPTMGGDPGTGHYVGGSGGLRDPGTLNRDDNDNIVPDTTSPRRCALDPVTGEPPGFSRGLKFLGSSFSSDASQCPGPSNMPVTPVSFQVFHVRRSWVSD